MLGTDLTSWNRGARRTRRVILCSALSAFSAVSILVAQTAPAEWRSYAGDLRNHHYSPLAQVNRVELQRARSRLALQDRQPRPASGIQARRHAADGATACSTPPPAPAGRSSRSTRRPASCCGCTRSAKARARRRRRGSCPGAASRTGPTAATSGSSTSRPAIVSSRSTPGPARASPSFGKDGIVDLKDDVGVRQRAADRSRDRRDRPARDARGHQRRRGDDRLVDARGRHAEDAQQHQRAGARLRRAHRQAAVDVQHDSAPGRVRQRHLGKRIVGGERQRRRLESDCASTRSSGSRICRSRRRARISTAACVPATTCSPRASSRSTTRPASASGTSSSCTIRSGTWTSRRRRCSSISPSAAVR